MINPPTTTKRWWKLPAMAAIITVMLGVTAQLAHAQPGGRRGRPPGPPGMQQGGGPPGMQQGQRGGQQRGQRGGQQQGQRGGQQQGGPMMMALFDRDRDGSISRNEVQNASTILLRLDRNNDGAISSDEMRQAQQIFQQRQQGGVGAQGPGQTGAGGQQGGPPCNANGAGGPQQGQVRAGRGAGRTANARRGR